MFYTGHWFSGICLVLCLAGRSLGAVPPQDKTAAYRLNRREPDAEQPMPTPLASPAPTESLRVASQVLLQPLPAIGRSRGHMRMASALLDLSRYNEALVHARQALEQSRHGANAQNTGLTYDLLGRVQVARGDTGRARQWYSRALHQFGRLQDSYNQAVVYEHLGDLYASQAAWEPAANSYLHASRIWEQEGAVARSAIGLHATGRMQLAAGQYQQAWANLQESIRRQQARHDTLAVAYARHTLGQLYGAQQQPQRARLEYATALGELPRQSSALLRAALYAGLAAANDSLGSFATAEQNLKMAVPLARQEGNLQMLSELYQSLAQLHQRQERYQLAFGELNHHLQLMDSVAARQREADVAAIRMRFETDKKEQEIVLLQQESQQQQADLQRQTWWRNGLGLGTLVLLVLAATLYLARRRQASINQLLRNKNLAIQQQKEELNRLNRSKDMLFSVISHDLRSPLSSLYTLLTLLNMGGIPQERLATHMDRLSRTLNTTLELLDNLLNWAMTQMRDEGVKTKVLALEDTGAECVRLLTLDAERKDVRLINLLPPCQVLADENMCRLILRNLISNAIKFTSPGGEVTISGRRRGVEWEISVADTGVGIEPAAQEKLRQAVIGYTTPGTAREEGTGLGLRLCREFVELNDGRLTFESTPGEGSVFRFTLPVGQAVPAAELSVAAG